MKALRMSEDEYKAAQQRLNRFGEPPKPPGRPKGAKAHKINAGKAEGLRRGAGVTVSGSTPPIPAPNKYGNVPTNGYASGRESKRAAELRLLAAAGAITDLKEQVRYELIPAQYVDGKCVERACHYIADFVFREHGVEVIEDSKGVRTPDYVIKRKLVLQRYGVRIRET